MSKTSQTKTIRANKVKKQGRQRKNALENHGTTKSWDELFSKK